MCGGRRHSYPGLRAVTRIVNTGPTNSQVPLSDQSISSRGRTLTTISMREERRATNAIWGSSPEHRPFACGCTTRSRHPDKLRRDIQPKWVFQVSCADRSISAKSQEIVDVVTGEMPSNASDQLKMP